MLSQHAPLNLSDNAIMEPITGVYVLLVIALVHLKSRGGFNAIPSCIVASQVTAIMEPIYRCMCF